MEVFGQPEKDGKLVADDVSGYKFITLRVFAKGPQPIRLELITRGQGPISRRGIRRRPSGCLRVSIRTNSSSTPSASPSGPMPLDLKRDVLKKLTSITVGVFCDKCTLEKGTVVVDNIAFEK